MLFLLPVTLDGRTFALVGACARAEVTVEWQIAAVPDGPSAQRARADGQDMPLPVEAVDDGVERPVQPASGVPTDLRSDPVPPLFDAAATAVAVPGQAETAPADAVIIADGEPERPGWILPTWIGKHATMRAGDKRRRISTRRASVVAQDYVASARLGARPDVRDVEATVALDSQDDHRLAASIEPVAAVAIEGDMLESGPVPAANRAAPKPADKRAVLAALIADHAPQRDHAGFFAGMVVWLIVAGLALAALAATWLKRSGRVPAAAMREWRPATPPPAVRTVDPKGATALPPERAGEGAPLQPIPWSINCDATVRTFDSRLRFTKLELLAFLTNSLERLIPLVADRGEGLSEKDIAGLMSLQHEIAAHRQVIAAQLEQFEAETPPAEAAA